MSWKDAGIFLKPIFKVIQIDRGHCDNVQLEWAPKFTRTQKHQEKCESFGLAFISVPVKGIVAPHNNTFRVSADWIKTHLACLQRRH